MPACTCQGAAEAGGVVIACLPVQVYGESSVGRDSGCTEASTLEPTNPYSAAKAGAGARHLLLPRPHHMQALPRTLHGCTIASRPGHTQGYRCMNQQRGMHTVCMSKQR